MDESEFVLVGKLTIKEISKNEEIRFAYKENVFEGRCVIYSNDLSHRLEQLLGTRLALFFRTVLQ